MNKVVNVTFTGGIIGLLDDSPQNKLNRVLKKENDDGWQVVQIVPAERGNLFLVLLRFLILLVTLLLYTKTNGYYLIMERITAGKQTNTGNPSINGPKCSKCGTTVKTDDTFCENCGNKLK